jgi:uncharacterized protein (DUF433 family)
MPMSMPTPLDDFALGLGVYSLPEAARIVGRSVGRATPRQLRSWINDGITPATRSESGMLLTFSDLVSLEVVSRFRGSNVSLQRVRRFETELRAHFPGLDRPFANNIFFTDGSRIWAECAEDEPRRSIELVGKRRGHYVWTGVIESFAKRIHYAPTGEAIGWELSEWVEIKPSIQFGSPVVKGTRVTVDTVAANLQVATASEVAEWYGLTVDQVVGVRHYLAEAA